MMNTRPQEPDYDVTKASAILGYSFEDLDISLAIWTAFMWGEVEASLLTIMSERHVKSP